MSQATAPKPVSSQTKRHAQAQLGTIVRLLDQSGATKRDYKLAEALRTVLKAIQDA